MRRNQLVRQGYSLLEVLTALTIFLFSLVAIGQLLSVASFSATEAAFTNRAQQLLQSKMNEVAAGILPLESTGESSFDEDPDWTYSVQCESEGSIPNLFRVTVKVTRIRPDQTVFETNMTQLIVDPTMKGVIEPPPSDASSSSGSGATGGSGTTSGAGTTGGP